VERILLASGDVKLESPLKLEDAGKLASLANDPSISQTIGSAGFPYPYTEEDARWFIEKNRIEIDRPFIIDWFIIYKNEPVGIIGLKDIDYENKRAHVGYWVNSRYRNKGIAGGSLRLVVDYSYRTLKMHRLYTSVMHNNPSSMRVLIKNGFSIEGIEKDSIFLKGKFYDMIKFGLIFRD
jgi:RimJ/RimL family protein N-acetyltransferase